jgi:hypothetical protein
MKWITVEIVHQDTKERIYKRKEILSILRIGSTQLSKYCKWLGFSSSSKRKSTYTDEEKECLVEFKDLVDTYGNTDHAFIIWQSKE